MKYARLLALALLLPLSAVAGTFAGGTPLSTGNDDSCDIGLYPAATLLLPYFEVGSGPGNEATTTAFTVTNVTSIPQIAHVTLWSDYGFPVVNFNIFLTGYDVQAINLYDVLVRGIIAPSSGTSSSTPPGARSFGNNTNPGFQPTATETCRQLPGNIPFFLLRDIKDGLTTGRYSSCGDVKIGGTHELATGYVTIDTVATCTTNLPTEPNYFTSDLLYDNVLVGDYQIVNPNTATGNYATGNPMVHIRAVPEGGRAGIPQLTNLPYTFYDRFTSNLPAGFNRTHDRRQPLSSTFAARFIEGGPSAFDTRLIVWREGVTGPSAACSAYSANNAMLSKDVVRFDEHENPTTLPVSLAGPPQDPSIALPATSAFRTGSSAFPPLANPTGDVAGWLYLNLNNGGSTAYSVTTNGSSQSTRPAARDFVTNSNTTIGVRQSQNWVVVSMSSEGRYAAAFDAMSLANGCTPAPRVSGGNVTIGPGSNVTP